MVLYAGFTKYSPVAYLVLNIEIKQESSRYSSVKILFLYRGCPMRETRGFELVQIMLLTFGKRKSRNRLSRATGIPRRLRSSSSIGFGIRLKRESKVLISTTRTTACGPAGQVKTDNALQASVSLLHILHVKAGFIPDISNIFNSQMSAISRKDIVPALLSQWHWRWNEASWFRRKRWFRASLV